MTDKKFSGKSGKVSPDGGYGWAVVIAYALFHVNKNIKSWFIF